MQNNNSFKSGTILAKEGQSCYDISGSGQLKGFQIAL